MRTRSKVFLDTNVLIYAADGADPMKQAKAQAAVKEIRANGAGVISTQVMQEFFSVTVRKLGMTPLDARRLTLALTDFEIVSITSDLVERGMDLTILHKLAFWDALIVAAAKESGCTKVLSEDLQAGRSIVGVTIESPW